ncbi:hypothetical protein [Streptomyces djakartensis]|uniref:Uncharacterized protein n=1 Tax=Streptomyces djakartensis TaxID=68193 RepID=A0ABQ2ZTS6_9ACTN|nr:hypothetical protein [Streptomyces djakartensis]GGY22407.1 hypothetical protein GCM10010384_31570 [Streptomyces djakartensis]
MRTGAAARRVAKSLVCQQRPASAVEFATAAARRRADGLTDRGALGRSTLGMLYPSAALAECSQARAPGAVVDPGSAASLAPSGSGTAALVNAR